MIDLKGLFKNAVSGGLSKLADSTKGIIEAVADGKLSKIEAMAQIDAEKNRHEEAMAEDSTRQMELVLADKQNAREMFKVNSGLQKIYAIVFLAAYVILSGAMCYMIYVISVHKIDLPDWGIGFISTIWGAMSMKVGTVTDFLFGASMTPEKK